MIKSKHICLLRIIEIKYKRKMKGICMKKLLYVILGIIFAFVALIIACAINPKLSDSLGELVNKVEGMEMSASLSDSLSEELNIPVTSVNVDVDPAKVSTIDEDIISDTVNVNPTMDKNMPAVDQNISMELSKLSGLEMPKIDFEVLDDATEKELVSNITEGEKGEEYVFDPLFYPYYALLDEDGQALYCQIYANAIDLNASFVPVVEVSPSEFEETYFSVVFDHPELFWLDNEYKGRQNRRGIVVDITLSFNRTANNIYEEMAVFEEEANSIIIEARNYSSEYEMEKYVHDKLAERITYVESAELNQNAYSALVNDETVCAGYARSFQYIMQQLDIPCYLCVGYAGEAHAWDIVLLDGDYYNVDVTWDDTSIMTYNYFNKTDKDYSKDHTRNFISVNLPKCEGEKYGNLEKNPANTNLRSVEDTGIDENLIFEDIDSYYEYCYTEIVNQGKGKYTFSCIVVGEDLLQTIIDELQGNAFKKAYMKPALIELDARSGSVNINGEILQDDCYLLIHEVVIK